MVEALSFQEEGQSDSTGKERDSAYSPGMHPKGEFLGHSNKLVRKDLSNKTNTTKPPLIFQKRVLLSLI